MLDNNKMLLEYIIESNKRMEGKIDTIIETAMLKTTCEENQKQCQLIQVAKLKIQFIKVLGGIVVSLLAALAGFKFF